MNSCVLFIALFCGCVVGGCQGEKESSLSTPTSNTTSWGRARPHNYPHAAYSYPSSHARSYKYPGRMSYPPSASLSDSSWRRNTMSPSTTTAATSTYLYPSNSSSSEDNTTIWLSELQFLTRTELSVDISLPRIPHTEYCSFITPDNKTITVEGNRVAGVNVYGSNSSEYVSCRIVVGPMEESLIGKWTICGSYTEDNVENRRCQRANIAWKNSENPSSVWQTTIQAEFKHVVYFRGILSPSVRGSGGVVSCHLVTPNKEDLLVTRDSEYPNIKLVQDTDSVCSIAIGPIEQSHLGSWVIYGTFNSTMGFNEVRLPMKLDLYNKNRPYEQAYNDTTLDPIEHVVNFGKTVAVEVESTGAVEVCIFTMPSGLSYNTIDPGMPSGVEFIIDNKICCRISIGPITEEMIGTWMLIGRFSDHGVYTQKIQWFNITLEDMSSRGRIRPHYYPHTSYSTATPPHARSNWFPERNRYPPSGSINLSSWGRIHPHYYPYTSSSTIAPSSHARSYGFPKRIRYPPSGSFSKWQTTTEAPQHNYTEPIFQDWGLNTTTLHTKPQSDRVVVEMPGSLAMDQDLHFAMSLVPMLHNRSLGDKLDVQMNVLQFFKSKLTRNRK